MVENGGVPVAIKRLEDGLEIRWDEAGHNGFYPARQLRLACPCAGCIEEMTGRPLLDPATVPDDIGVQALELVGAYALKIRWSDGHSTGIYTFRVLLEGCPCSACSG